MRIVILHHEILTQRPDDLDVLNQALAVQEALLKLGFEVEIMPVGLDLPSVVSKLTQKVDLVFNLVETLEDRPELISVIPSLLEAHKIPFTGSSALSILSTTDKISTKRILKANNLLTPDWIETNTFQAQSTILPTHKYLIKPRMQDGSVGITLDSIINSNNLETVIEATKNHESKIAEPCFAEAYIDGREFNVSLLQVGQTVEVLPIPEMQFLNFEHREKILTYDAKWEENKDNFYAHRLVRNFSNIEETLKEKLIHISLTCWELFQLKGYARVDIRVDNQGQPFILEINANPCIAKDAGFPAACLQKNYSYIQMVDYICQAALSK